MASDESVIRGLRKATRLMWLSVLIGVPKPYLDFDHLARLGATEYLAVTVLVTFAVLAWLIVMLSRGRNWARVLLALGFVLGGLASFRQIPEEFGRSPLLGLLSLVQVVLQGVALVIVFSEPARRAFVKTAAHVAAGAPLG